jgi:hypothetical protein
MLLLCACVGCRLCSLLWMFYCIALLTTGEAKFPECHGLPRVPKITRGPLPRGPLPRKLFPECCTQGRLSRVFLALPRVLEALREAGGSCSDSYWEIGIGHRGHGLPWPTLGSASAQGQSYIYSLVGATAPHSKRKNIDYIQLSPYCTLKKNYMHPPEELHPSIYSSFTTISACMWQLTTLITHHIYVF